MGWRIQNAETAPTHPRTHPPTHPHPPRTATAATAATAAPTLRAADQRRVGSVAPGGVSPPQASFGQMRPWLISHMRSGSGLAVGTRRHPIRRSVGLPAHGRSVRDRSQVGNRRTEDRSLGPPLGDDSAAQPSSARDAVNQMLDTGLLDDVMDRVDAGGLRLTGEGGFLP